MGAANANDNDFSDGDDPHDDQFGADFPLGHHEIENEEQKAGSDAGDNNEFGDFSYDFENAGSS